jgi:integrase
MPYIRKTDAGTWKARVKIPDDWDVDNHQPSKTFDLRRQAKEWANEMENEINKGEYVEEEDVTLGECMDRWLEKNSERNKWSGSTEDRYRGLVRNHLKPELGKYNPEQLGPADIEDFYHERMESGKRPDGSEKPVGFDSVRQMDTILRQTYKMAIKREYIHQKQSPMDWVDLPTDKKDKNGDSGSSRVYLNREEVSEFLTTARKETDYWIFWILGFYTGARRSEILGLKYEDVDFAQQKLTIQRMLEIRDSGEYELSDELKSENAERTISIKDELIEAIKKWKEKQEKWSDKYGQAWSNKHDLICTSRKGTPLGNLQRKLNHIKSEAEIDSEKLDDFSIHDMRHTHAGLIFNDAPEGEGNRYIKIASQRLGHCNIKFTMDTYQEVLPGTEEEVVDAALDGVEIEI